MYNMYNLLNSAVQILTESENPTFKEEMYIQTILEDGESPITNKYLEKLYDSVMTKNHIDFEGIPLSKGNIVEYGGYTNMIEVLENVLKLASDSKSQIVVDYVNIVKQAIRNMIALSTLYQKGFKMKNDYVMLEYNTLVYTIIQATSAILYEFVEYIKSPNQKTMTIRLNNTKYKANSFYFDQLNKFNMICKKMNYPKYLEAMIQNGRENFTGAEVIGIVAVVSVALAIIPILRELVYRFYNIKSALSDCLAQQAYFLEMNKTVVEANTDFNEKKKDAILIRQEKIKNLCIRLSEKLRVTHVKSIDAGKVAIQNDNKLLTLDGIKKEVSDSPLQLF